MRPVRHSTVNMVFAVLACGLAPLLLELIGFRFQTIALGGVGENFAGYTLSGFVLRLDLILIFGGGLGLHLYLVLKRKRPGEEILGPLALTLALAALTAAVQFVPRPAGGMPEALFRSRIFHIDQLTHTFSALLILAGSATLALRRRLPGRRTMIAVSAVGVVIFAASLVSQRCYGFDRSSLVIANGVRFAAFVGCAVLLRPLLRLRPIPIYVVATLAGLFPQAVVQILILLPGFDPAVGIVSYADMLHWSGYLFPALGLSYDLARSTADHIHTSEQTYLRRVLDTLPDMVFVRDAESRYRLVNRAAADFLGGTRDDLEGKRLTDIVEDPQLVARSVEVDLKVLETGRPWQHDGIQVVDAAGRRRWVSMQTQLLPAGDGEPDQILGVTTDITELKKAERLIEQQLSGETTLRRCLTRLVRLSTEEYAQTLDDMLAEIGRYCDADSVFIYRIDADAGLAHQVRIWRNGKTPARLKHRMEFFDWAVPRLENGETVTYADPENLPDDPVAVAVGRALGARYMAMAPVCDQGGDLWGILGVHCPEHPYPDDHHCRRILAILADLYSTARGRWLDARDLQEAKDAAEASDRAKSEFLANMSHEIRTPLNAVIGIADILRGLQPTSEQSRYLEMVHQAGDALLGLINDVLDVSKIESGQLTLSPVVVDLPALLAEVVDMNAYLAQQQGLELIYHLDPAARLRVTADPLRLRQIVLNLLSNAIKFTEIGHVALRVDLDEQGRCRFVVEDTGIGIPPDKMAHVFDKFTQADTSDTRRFGGSGLGLAICGNLVELMDGTIAVESECDRGTTFTVAIPLEGEPAPDRAPLPDPDLRDLRYLGVLSSAAAAANLDTILADLGLSGEVLQDAVAASERLRKPDCDVLFVDGQMDSMLVSSLRRAAAALPAAERPRMILLTPLGDDLDDGRIKREGWSAVLHKPARDSTLRQALRAVGDPGAETVVPVEENIPVVQDGTRVLLVEDNLFNQKVATRLLENLGCRIALAENGREAVDLAAAGDYHLVLMDCQMPVMDGLEATRLIRELDGSRGQVPVVAMTANVLGDHRESCLAAGMNDFASKPINKKTLRDLLARWAIQPAV